MVDSCPRSLCVRPDFGLLGVEGVELQSFLDGLGLLLQGPRITGHSLLPPDKAVSKACKKFVLLLIYAIILEHPEPLIALLFKFLQTKSTKRHPLD